ncbi:MAG: hypothetical protein CM1200mP18_02160 [Gammaproteobacteria bacterium]|nr:MAG: hypothetical protein CM1200mP18_02160 [Gammaproteobacteria bacterium]
MIPKSRFDEVRSIGWWQGVAFATRLFHDCLGRDAPPGPNRAEYEAFQAFTLDRLGLALGDDKKYLCRARAAASQGGNSAKRLRQYFRRLSSDRSGAELQLFSMHYNDQDVFTGKRAFRIAENEIYPTEGEKFKQSPLGKLRLWSAGCSRGKEVYSMAFEAADIFEQELERALILNF